MCTGQLYRIENLNKFNPSTNSYDYIIYCNKNHDVFNRFNQHLTFRIQQIPCGKCWECKIQKSKEWAFRCMKEAKKYENNIMLTLTYDEEHIPKTEYVNIETGEIETTTTLSKDDHQKFMKRLRKAFPDYKIKFMLAGEYGGETDRPHYHIICFNLKVDDMKFYKYSNTEWSKVKNELYNSKKLNKIWGKGFVVLNEVNYETCAYVARYTTKKLFGEKAEEEYTNKNRVAPYICMSRNPGIGHDFFEENIEKFEKDKKFFQMTKKGLQEMKPGRYYDKLMEKHDPELLQQIKAARVEKSQAHWDNLLNYTDIQKHEYIQNKEYINNQKQKKLIRGL